MTHDQFKQGVDTIDTGLPERPDLTTIRARGRAVRRRRRSVAVVGGLAAAAVIAVPLATGALGGPGGDRGGDRVQVADGTSTTPSPSPTPTPSAPPTRDGSAYADQSRRMTAAVADVFPQARRISDDPYDSMVWKDGAIDIALSDPPRWATLFRWNQGFAYDGLQYLETSAVWESDTPGMQRCSVMAFAEESACDVTRLDDGYLLVTHDGVRLQGEPDGDWSRFVQVISPASDAGLVQTIEVWAQEEDMTWAQADAALPSLDDLAAIASDERMRLPEPLALPEPE